MVQKLSSFFYKVGHVLLSAVTYSPAGGREAGKRKPRSEGREPYQFYVILNSIQHPFNLQNCVLLIFFIGIVHPSFSQEENPTKKTFTNFKTDSSYKNFNELRYAVAKAQIVSLKKGALLVRLKTNANSISRLKAAGKMDLATQVERETFLNNKAIMKAYRELTFCPVFFFNSDCSDSVKHKNLAGIFLDSNLTVDPSIVCNASFYLIAEQGTIYDSSLGLVPESRAATVAETGTPSKEVFVVVKNRYFIQLHKPFPYYQAGYSPKKYTDYIKKFNALLLDFYKQNSNYVIPAGLNEYVY